MKRSISKNSWILVSIIAIAWTFSFWSTHPTLSRCFSNDSILGIQQGLKNDIVYRAIPQNYHLIHLQIGGSRYYMDNVPSWIKVEIEVDENGAYTSHKVLDSSNEYLEFRLNRYIADIKFLPAYDKDGPTTSSVVMQFVY